MEYIFRNIPDYFCRVMTIISSHHHNQINSVDQAISSDPNSCITTMNKLIKRDSTHRCNGGWHGISEQSKFDLI